MAPDWSLWKSRGRRASRLRTEMLLLFMMFIAVTTSCSKDGRSRSNGKMIGPNVLRLAEWMEGTFSNSEQAAADPQTYFSLILETRRIWENRTDGVWLYVEQAVTTRRHRPYRQKILRLYRINDHKFAAETYLLLDPLRFAGESRNPLKLNRLTPDSLEEKSGCTVYLQTQSDTAFYGSSEGNKCPGDLAIAKYVESDWRVTEKEYILWERGYDRSGKQVSGPAQKGYTFKKTGTWRNRE